MSRVKSRDMPKGKHCPSCLHENSLKVINSYDTPMENGCYRCTDYVGCLDCGFAFYCGWTEDENGNEQLKPGLDL